MDDDTNRVDDSEISDQTDSTDARPPTVRHNWQQSGRPSVMVVEAVAAATDRPTTELPPLQGTLDADALDTLLNGQSSSVTVSFRYADTAVSVSENGSIEVHVDGDLREENDG
ncbi:hypothetical protein PM085_19340 [Halorubrum ezzemoulense]|jgi:hypothetical protein|uniref:Halobacterial output domain-containing protein n=1 Tax=Halorubrum ezzemoulense TaxID=337243 RepID=A0ABT4Z8G6_HALEZ|nr:HalOD1 output domain-containing protein [Halorubrum ezzemoulense]MDB2294367.1 hypothetical protein [Halorubrum ezzemoulense]